jgi:hypothetical protein
VPHPRFRSVRSVLGIASGLALTAALAGCGFVAAGDKSSVKPSSFVISGAATVTLPVPGVPGAACTSPSGAADVAADAPVVVTNSDGTRLAAGQLGRGVVSGDGSACAFPFQIRAVPGGYDTYDVAVGTRPAQPFEAAALRANEPAVLTITPSP